jgi:protein-disulfide isomerase
MQCSLSSLNAPLPDQGNRMGALSKGFGSSMLLTLMLGLSGCHDPHEEEIGRLRVRLDSFAVTLTAVTKALQNGGQSIGGGPDSAIVSINPIATLGSESAPVTVIEFTDYQCPFCARHASTTMLAIKRDYIDRGLVRYQIRDLPLTEIHPFALSASLAARCAASERPESFWPYHDRLFESQRQLADSTFLAIATELGIDRPRFTACMQSNRFGAEITRDVDEARVAGLGSTPAFVIGSSIRHDSIRGSVLLGALPYESFRAAIDAALMPAQTALAR